MSEDHSHTCDSAPPSASLLLQGLDLAAFHETLRNARQRLLDERNEQGWWTGELSSSALSTATAIVAMELARRNGCEAAAGAGELIERGIQWLITMQNEDGGWGDTDKSKSNISTTMLVWAAMGLLLPLPLGEGGGEGGTKEKVSDREVGDAKATGEFISLTPALSQGERGRQAIARCEAWLANHAGSMEVSALVEAVMKRYGKDRTFSVPILTMCALCGRLGPVEDAATWKWVKQLPFEFAAFPRSWFKVLNLQVVSYALPALIAIGLVRHHHRPTWNPITRLARWMTRSRVLALLEKIQPPHGGFLEATPLTSFVSMSLAACGFGAHPVVTRGIQFIKQSARPDGSWPIDTNLATWVTTLSVNALAAGRRIDDHLNEHEQTIIRDWILKQQYKAVHPYTGAAPGGWAWTDLPGGVPDADDTSGAVIALNNLSGASKETQAARDAGLAWIAGLQNSDGGIPTFCRGWGQLPFDRSNPDITAHFILAAGASLENAPEHLPIPGVRERSEQYLQDVNRPDGSFVPLWFGNQHQSDELNPTYGTARVSMALLRTNKNGHPPLAGADWLVNAAHSSGGWGGDVGLPPSIEETGLAVEALATLCWVSFDLPRMMIESLDEKASPGALRDHVQSSVIPLWHSEGERLKLPLVSGIHWLIEHTHRGTSFPPSPIGFYFAKLWYYEKLYPIIYTVAALERVAGLLAREE